MTTQTSDHEKSGHKQAKGFILLEALMAMSLIMGSWMVSSHVYQGLALTLSQQESKRSQLRKEMDVHEVSSQVRKNTSLEVGGIKNDAPRVLGRNHALHSTAKSIAKGKRSLSDQANGI